MHVQYALMKMRNMWQLKYLPEVPQARLNNDNVNNCDEVEE